MTGLIWTMLSREGGETLGPRGRWCRMGVMGGVSTGTLGAKLVDRRWRCACAARLRFGQRWVSCRWQLI